MITVALNTGMRQGEILAMRKDWIDLKEGLILIPKRLKGKPGVDRLRFHDLRHTTATNLARSRKDMKFIAQYLGHTDVKTSARYIQLQ
ncbi:MAG: tyrosine-type recombinase/integrase [Thermodesulfobacteriota bacterium]